MFRLSDDDPKSILGITVKHNHRFTKSTKSGYLCTNLELPPEVLNLPGEQRVPRPSLPTVPEFSWKEGHSCFCFLMASIPTDRPETLSQSHPAY